MRYQATGKPRRLDGLVVWQVGDFSRSGEGVPVWWTQSSDTATLLIYEDRGIASPDAISQVPHQSGYLRGCIDIAREQDKAQRLGRGKERRFIRRHRQAR